MESATELHNTRETAFYTVLGLGLLLVGLTISFFLFPFKISGDGIDRQYFMDILIHQHKVLPMRYSMIGPLASLPVWWLSSFFKDPTAVVARYNFILFVVFLIGFAFGVKKQFKPDFLLTVFILLAFGSMLPGHLLNYYGEVFSAVCFAAGLTGLAMNKSWIGWTLVLLGVMNMPALMVPFILVVGYFTWESRRLRYLGLIPLVAVLLVAESYLRTGSITTGFMTYLSQDHGYETFMPYSGKIGYSYPFGLGILSILFSFGKGLLFFCPGLILAGIALKTITNPVERRLLILWLLASVGLVFAYASWWAWYGGWFWGPRFFLFASFTATWILARLIHSRPRSFWLTLVLVAMISLSMWVGMNGVVFRQNTLEICSQNSYALESLCWYVPEFSPLFRPFFAHATLHFNERLLVILFGVIWLYLVIPLGIELSRRSLQAARGIIPSLKLNSWKF